MITVEKLVDCSVWTGKWRIYLIDKDFGSLNRTICNNHMIGGNWPNL